LLDAPRTDDASNRTQIRFSRKTKEQYVMTEVDGKATGWKAYFNTSGWVAEGSGKPAPKKKAKAKPRAKAKSKAAASSKSKK
jgi:DNA topoisomerase-1